LLEGFTDGFTLGDVDAREVGFALGEGATDLVGCGVALSSLIVTLIFCPGWRFSTPTFADGPFVDGLIFNPVDEVGLGEGETGAGADGEGVGEGVGATDGFFDGVGVGFGVEVGAGEGFGEGVGATDGFGVAVGVGVADGVGDGVGVGVADGVGVGSGVGTTAAGTDPPPFDGGGVEGLKYETRSGVIGSDGSDGAEGPTEVTVVTVNVYGVPFVNPETVMGDDVPVAVSPVSTTVTM